MGPFQQKPSSRAFEYLLVCALVFWGTGCAYYSFTGATIPSHLNTIAIPLVEDNSLSPLANLDDELTELLLDRFISQTRLSLEPDENTANVILTVRIERYTNMPTAVGGGNQAELNRINISVNVRYFDQIQDEEIVQRTFSSSEEYDPSKGLDEEHTAASAVLENIADDIFTAATSNW